MDFNGFTVYTNIWVTIVGLVLKTWLKLKFKISILSGELKIAKSLQYCINWIQYWDWKVNIKIYTILHEYEHSTMCKYFATHFFANHCNITKSSSFLNEKNYQFIVLMFWSLWTFYHIIWRIENLKRHSKWILSTIFNKK